MPNTLLSQSNIDDPVRKAAIGETPNQEGTQMSENEQAPDTRTWLYCAECPDGQIFEGDEVQEALDEGWVDSPTKIGESDDEPETGPIVDNGGGWFTVTHGDHSEKVQGRDNAEAKLAELQAAG